MSIFIQSVDTMEEVALCRKLAAQVWGEPSACSIPQMSVHAKYGGVLLLAFDDATPVGFLFSFPALYRGEWVLWSHETAVLPGYLHQGIGAELKRTQRQRAEDIGYDKIAWTFDPLVSRNAYFNLNKLGARVSEYKINAYGMDDTDQINRGMETDRFIAVWDVKDDSKFVTPHTQLNSGRSGRSDRSERPEHSDRVLHSNLSQTTSNTGYEWIAFGENKEPVLSPRNLSRLSVSGAALADEHQGDNAVRIETAIPLDFESMVGGNRNLAIAWRLVFRESALELMREGYRPSLLVIESAGASENSGNSRNSGNSFAKYIWTRAGERK